MAEELAREERVNIHATHAMIPGALFIVTLAVGIVWLLYAVAFRRPLRP